MTNLKIAFIKTEKWRKGGAEKVKKAIETWTERERGQAMCSMKEL